MAAPVFRMGRVMAIPPDLDVDRCIQRIDALSAQFTEALVRIEALEHRVRTVEAVRRIDAVLDRSPE